MHKKIIKEHFDSIADRYDLYKRRNRYYHNGIKKFCRSVIPQGETVLELGCATGDLLDGLKPSEGVGIDFSPKMIELAKNKYRHLTFLTMEAESLNLKRKFNYVVMSNLLDYLEDIWVVLENTKQYLNTDGKIIITTVNPAWEPIFRVGWKLGLRTPDTSRNFITNQDIINLLKLEDFEILKEGLRMVLPKNIPIISPILNFIIPELPVLRQLCVMQYVVAKIKRPKSSLSCSVSSP